MGKSSFILHIDNLSILDKMDDEMAGKLIKAIYHYQITKELPKDKILDLILTAFINQFNRDEIKYKKICDRNKANGNKGGRPRKNPKITQNNPLGLKEPKETQMIRTYPKKADSDSDSDSDIKKRKKDKKKNNKIIIDQFETFWKLYPRKKGKSTALKSWNTCCKLKLSERPNIKTIKKALKLQIASEQWQDMQYIPHPSTWLNQHRWEDVVDTPSNKRKNNAPSNGSRTYSNTKTDYSKIKSIKNN